MKIMIVDDSKTMIRILSTAIQTIIKDAEVLLCYNGQEAFTTLEANQDIRLILLDVCMPIMSGSEFLTKIRQDKKYDNVKVIMETTENSQSERQRLIDLGITGYLLKPYRTSQAVDLMIELAPIVGYEINKE